MAAEHHQLHFVLVPLMAQGHMIPMIDMARLLAQRGVIVTFVTTLVNASRFKTTIDRAVESGLPIRLLPLRFPCLEAGLPEGCENLDSIPSADLIRNFLDAASMLQQPLEQYLQQQQQPPPNCIIADSYLPWTSRIANKFQIPRLIFHGMCCFSLLGSHNVQHYNAHKTVSSDSEPFMVPGMLHRVEITKAQLPGSFVVKPELEDIRRQMREADLTAYGVVMNSFKELELGYVEEYQKAIQKKVWCIGPVSLCNKDDLDKFERGNKASVEQNQCLAWLDSMKPKSVLYVCLGSQCRLVPLQLIELGLGLEASNYPFIWVIRTADRFAELEKWLLEEGFEERIKGRGLLIKGWAPQVQILSHPAIYRVLDTLWMEFNTGINLCRCSNDNMAYVCRAVLQ
uniref:Glycosyltransferase N-terminal domain-containing protein n=1 Tax=Nelumbo nucifera TaxID=4432 RepID=A0A822YAP9_NELNU|nr:TPA_asm: hypothetical protein HUJ06_030079 [Nelumbo nucifera]